MQLDIDGNVIKIYNSDIDIFENKFSSPTRRNDVARLIKSWASLSSKFTPNSTGKLKKL
jgi:hypothetical protein